MKRTPLKRKTRLLTRREKPRKVAGKLPDEPQRSRCGPPRDPKYAAWIRTHPCIVPGCRALVREHCHVGSDGGMALKGSDYRAVPMCGEHHRTHGQHQHGHLPGMTPEETRDLFKREAQRLFREWIKAGGVPVKSNQKTRPRMADWESEATE